MGQLFLRRSLDKVYTWKPYNLSATYILGTHTPPSSVRLTVTAQQQTWYKLFPV